MRKHGTIFYRSQILYTATGIRTRVLALRTPRPWPLDDSGEKLKKELVKSSLKSLLLFKSYTIRRLHAKAARFLPVELYLQNNRFQVQNRQFWQFSGKYERANDNLP